MKKIDGLISALYAIIMVVLVFFGSCYLDLWMLILGAVVIMSAILIMYRKKQEDEQEPIKE